MLCRCVVPEPAYRGDFRHAEQELVSVHRWAAQADFPFREESVAAAAAWLALWHGRADDLLDRLLSLDERSPTDMGTAVLLLMLRGDRLEQAAAYLDERPVPLL